MTGPQRLASLDAFRGFAIAGMVLVNNPGSWKTIYGPLDHAEWNGCTFTDLIFPFFLFAAGLALTISLGRKAHEGKDRPGLLRGIVRRAGIIFLIGLLLNLIPSFSFASVRILGVLPQLPAIRASAGHSKGPAAAAAEHRPGRGAIHRPGDVDLQGAGGAADGE